MAKILLDGGHGLYTAGKRTPNDEREWSFNNKVVIAAIRHLNNYENVQTLRLDDPTGKIDVSLKERTDKANEWKGDVLVSAHHNAHLGVWGSHTGTSTHIYLGNQPESMKLAKEVHARLVKAYGLRDRGIQQDDFHMVRDSKMPSILVEGGFMDSTIDIKKLRDNKVLEAAGKAIAEGVAAYLKLKLKTIKKEGVRMFKPSTRVLKDEMVNTLQAAYDAGILSSAVHAEKARKDELPLDDAVGLLATITRRVYLTK